MYCCEELVHSRARTPVLLRMMFYSNIDDEAVQHTAETNARTAADADLQDNIDDEESARIAADTALTE